MSIVQCQKAGLKSQAGFTLVELAIVMIIIGLLIGGVLKGQQLITNAQIAATVAQVKGIDAATTSFRDMYNALPGDILNPGGRLPNCAGPPCNLPGDGNGSLGTAAALDTPSTIPVAGLESANFFTHLAVAGLLTGINPTAYSATWGGSFPATKISGGGIYPGSSAGAAADFAGVASAVGMAGGLYLTLISAPTVAPAAGAGLFLTPNQAARIDTKLDDGIPGQGTVRAFGGATCFAGVPLIYAETLQSKTCGLFVQIQG